MLDAEWKVFSSKVEQIISSGANVIFDIQSIGDAATQAFARAGIACLGRIDRNTMQRAVVATHGALLV